MRLHEARCHLGPGICSALSDSILDLIDLLYDVSFIVSLFDRVTHASSTNAHIVFMKRMVYLLSIN